MTQPVERPTVEAERIVREFWGNPASQRVFPTPAAMNLMEAITAAIRAEREACAKVAEEWSPLGYAGDVGGRIAAAIRTRPA